MKKLLLVLLVLVTTLTIAQPAMATPNVSKSVFEEDESACKALQLSVYRGNIREKKDDKWAACDCQGLCYCNSLYHVLEDKEDRDFYTEFFNNYPISSHGKVYSDCSFSMDNTFSYEKRVIFKNLQPFLQQEKKEVKEVFKNPKINLYGFLNSFRKVSFLGQRMTMSKKMPIIITDLWEIQGEKVLKYAGDVAFCVPYSSTNKQGVLHCETVVNDLLEHHVWHFTSIYIVYTDSVIAEYSYHYNGLEGHIDIYVP